MQVLKNSGYTSQFRKEVLDSGVKGYNKILSDHFSGIKPIYRSKEWQKTSRRMDKNNKRKHWLDLFLIKVTQIAAVSSFAVLSHSCHR